MKQIFMLIPLLIILCFSIACQQNTQEIDLSELKTYENPPSMTIDQNKDYQAVFYLEKGGTFKVDLFEKITPITVNNFVFLANDDYYDNTSFHRVIDDFMAQGGDPTGTGAGGPGYYFENEFDPDTRHDSAGILSMANKGMQMGKGTNGSQFFITFKALHPLDGYESTTSDKLKNCNMPMTSCHTVFGKVIEGMDVVNNISRRDPLVATELGDIIKDIEIKIIN
mgnify:FL=1|tara:strand:- start:707 stop:1378 length:672 start_codon:yes stop_codon:yes gene_type:complete